MLNFEKKRNAITLIYRSDVSDSEWVYERIKSTGGVRIANAFHFEEKDLITSPEDHEEFDEVKFKLALAKGEYFHIRKRILGIDSELYIHKSIKLVRKMFITERSISIFSKISELVSEDVYIGGEMDGAIPQSDFDTLIKEFPNSYELKRYASARISSIVSSHINTKQDYEKKYNAYMDKKVSVEGGNLEQYFAKFECDKYLEISKKLKGMLRDEVNYSETQWQKEILHIILLIYPKYIRVFKEVSVRDPYAGKNRFIDYLLVDSNGNVDIIEIKKPFDKNVVTTNTYRDNYVPLRELSGAVMQAEKYIFYLSKSGMKGEEKLTNKYKGELPRRLDIKVTNPGGIIIMGRSNNLSKEQKQDFEIIKRKYKNLIDILTYDDLLDRLDVMISKWTDVESVTRA